MTAPDPIRAWAAPLCAGATPLEIGAPAGTVVTIGYAGPKFAVQRLARAQQGEANSDQHSQWPELAYTTRTDPTIPGLLWIEVTMPAVPTVAWLVRHNPNEAERTSRAPILLRQDSAQRLSAIQVTLGQIHILSDGLLRREAAKQMAERHRSSDALRGTQLAVALVSAFGGDDEARRQLQLLRQAGNNYGQALPPDLEHLANFSDRERIGMFNATHFFLDLRRPRR
jgi:hypothetical protein